MIPHTQAMTASAQCGMAMKTPEGFPPPPSLLQQVNGKGSQIAIRVSDVNTRLQLLHERVFGPMPQETRNASVPSPAANCAANELEAVFEVIDRRLCELERLAVALERFA
jgi:hypothetical protein